MTILQNLLNHWTEPYRAIISGLRLLNLCFALDSINFLPLSMVNAVIRSFPDKFSSTAIITNAKRADIEPQRNAAEEKELKVVTIDDLKQLLVEIKENKKPYSMAIRFLTFFDKTQASSN